MAKSFVNAIFLSGLILFFSGFTFAQEATDWQEDEFVKSRLIASHKAVPASDQEPFYVGWQVQLAEGWKTYWRTPGNAGFPPHIDWEGSVNVASANLLYPLPQRFEIFDLFTYGYHDEVVYPIRVKPVVEGAPVTLKANIRFLVCEDLCVPKEANFKMVIPAGETFAPTSINAGIIDSYLQMVPGLNGPQSTGLKISGVQVLGSGPNKNLAFQVAGENLMTGADLIVEDQPGLKFGIPQKRVLEDPKQAEFIVPVYRAGDNQSLEDRELNVIISDGWGNAEEIVLELTE